MLDLLSTRRQKPVGGNRVSDSGHVLDHVLRDKTDKLRSDSDLKGKIVQNGSGRVWNAERKRRACGLDGKHLQKRHRKTV